MSTQFYANYYKTCMKHRSYLCCSSGYKNIMAERPRHQHSHNLVQQPPALPFPALRSLKSHHSVSEFSCNSTKVSRKGPKGWRGRFDSSMQRLHPPQQPVGASLSPIKRVWIRSCSSTDGPPSSFFST